MNKNRIILCSLLVIVFTLNVSQVDSRLWDLLIAVEVVNGPILPNNPPIIEGQVVDHAGKPIANAEVQIRLGAETIFTNSDEVGKFSHEFENMQLSSGMHLIIVKAIAEDQRIGIAEKKFQVKGPIRISDSYAGTLSSPEAKRYLYASAEDFQNNPIGMKLYEHYQNLKEKYQIEEMRETSLERQQQNFEERRKVSENMTTQAIDEFDPGVGIYSGWRYDYFVDNLDRSVRGIIENQLNHTLNSLKEAQMAMRNILENGGTFEEARQAYFEKVAISQEMMNQLSVEKNQTITDTNSTDYAETIIVEKSIDEITNATETDESVQIDINGTDIKVGMSGAKIYLNVNGTLVEFLVNGTQLIPITNSSQQ